MTSETRDDFPHQFLSCHWPQEFKSRRWLPRQIENEPFIEYCRNIETQPLIEHLTYHSVENGDDEIVEGSDACEDDLGENDESEGDESEDDSEEDEDNDGVGEEQKEHRDGKKRRKRTRVTRLVTRISKHGIVEAPLECSWKDL